MIRPASSTATRRRTVTRPVARSISTTAAYAPEAKTWSDPARARRADPAAGAAGPGGEAGGGLKARAAAAAALRGGGGGGAGDRRAAHRRRAAGERADARGDHVRVPRAHGHALRVDP